MKTKTAISIKGLRKDFPSGLRGLIVRAVDDLNLEIKENEIFGLLGPNGSGKSTTIKILLGLLNPTRGEASIFDQPSDKVAARRLIGYLPEAPYFYRYLSGRELVMLFARLSGLQEKSAREKRADEIIELVGLKDAQKRPIKTYSKGMLQRIGLAQALVQNPPLVILDEPTAGVDPIGAAGISDIVRNLKANGKTVLLCSHLLSQVESLCDRVAVLNKGKLLAEGPLGSLLTEQSESLRIDGLNEQQRAQATQLLNEKFGNQVTTAPLGLRLDEFFLNLVKSADQTDVSPDTQKN